MMRSQRHWFWLIAIILVGFALRVYQVDSVALRGDEAFSVQYWAGQPLGETFSTIATIEPHPPLTYVIFRVWGGVVGLDNPFALRMFPILSNLIGVVVMFVLGTRLHSRQAGLLAALLWAIHPFEIWHAQDFRNYALWATTSALTLYMALRVLHSPTRKYYWLSYAVVACSSAMIFYFELITLGVMLIYGWVRLWRKWRWMIFWTGLHGAIIMATLLVFFALQGDLVGSGAYGGTTGGFELNALLGRFIPTLAFGDTLPPSISAPLGIILIVVMVVCLMEIWRGVFSAAWFVGLLWILPMIVLAVASLRLNIFAPRYIMNSIPTYLLAIAIWSVISWHASRKVLSVLVVLIWCAISLVALSNHYANDAYRKAPDWPALVGYLAEHTAPDEVIIQRSVDAGFGYYYEIIQPGAGEFALPETPQQPAHEIVATLEETAQQAQSIWITGTTFRDWASAGVVEQWLNDNMQRVRQTNISGQPIVQYKHWDVAEGFTDAVLAEWADTTRLIAQRILPPEPTDELTVWLYWQPIAQTAQPLTAFVHLVGEPNPATGSPLWAQDDHPPQDGRISTTAWDSEVIYRDVFVLPLADVAAGDYSLYVGFYDVQGKRVVMRDGADSFLLGEVSVE